MKSSISHTMQPGRGRNQPHQHGYGHRHPNQYLRRRPSSLFGTAWEGLFSAMLIERVMRPWAMAHPKTVGIFDLAQMKLRT